MATKKLNTTERRYIDGNFTNVKALDNNHFEGIVATSNQDRMGETLSIDGLDTTKFMSTNPIVIFGHNYNEPEYTIGKALTLSKTKDGKLPTTFEIFDDIPESKAPLVKKLIKKGVLGLSIGFVPKEIDGDTFTKSEMVEFSVVPVPANAEGAITGRSLGLSKKEFRLVFKGAISSDLPLADEAVSWDSGEAIKRVKKWASDADGNIDFKKYRKAFFWVDPENADKQGGYKLPFADIIDGDLKAVWRGVAAAMGVLQGARGGVDIPDGDKDAVLSQVKKYYKKFGKDVPDEAKDGNDVVENPESGNKVEQKGAVADELAEDENQEQKWANMDAVWEVFGAFCDVYYDDDTPVADFQTLLRETVTLLQQIANDGSSDNADENDTDGEYAGAVTMSLKEIDREKLKSLAKQFVKKNIITKDDSVTYLQTVLQDIANVDNIVDRLCLTLSDYLGMQNPDTDANDLNNDVTKGNGMDKSESESAMSTGNDSGKETASNTVKSANDITDESLKEIEKIKGIDISTLKDKDLGELAEMLKTLSVAVEKAQAASAQATKADSPATVRKRRLVLRDTRRAATQADKVVEQVLVELKKLK